MVDVAGEHTVADAVIASVASSAMEKLDGIKPVTNIASGFVERFGRKGQGMVIKQLEDGVEIEMKVSVRYGLNIPKKAQEAQQAIIKAVEDITGIKVLKVKIKVESLEEIDQLNEKETEKAAEEG